MNDVSDVILDRRTGKVTNHTIKTTPAGPNGPLYFEFGFLTTGATYADLGATITAPQADLNLGLIVLVDNATSTDGTVQIDTTKPGTHTVLYTVTDPNGLTGSATRTVIVAANDNQPTASTSTPANDNQSPLNATTTATSTAGSQ